MYVIDEYVHIYICMYIYIYICTYENDMSQDVSVGSMSAPMSWLGKLYELPERKT